MKVNIASAIDWFNPMAWIAAEQFKGESGSTSDDCVVRAGIENVVRSISGGKAPNRFVAVSMAEPSKIHRRLRDSLAENCNHASLRRRALFATSTLCSLVLLPLATLSLAAQSTHAPNHNAILKTPAGSFGSAKRRVAGNVLEFDYYSNLASGFYPNRPITMIVKRDSQGQQVYQFTDKRTGQTFRDAAQIRRNAEAVIAQGTASRPGTRVVHISDSLIRLLWPGEPNTYRAGVYLNLSQRQTVEGIEQELKASRRLDVQRVLDDKDIEPDARLTKLGLEISFSPAGQKKIAAFTKAHLREQLGVSDHDDVIDIPTIVEPLDFRNLTLSLRSRSKSQAAALVEHLNAPKSQ